MAIDSNFINRFQQQIDLLKKLEKSIQGAIDRADEQINKMREGKSMEELFGPVPPKQGPPAPGDGG